MGHFQTHALQHSGIYSITSSAVLSNDAGISMPIALAVLSRRFGASGTSTICALASAGNQFKSRSQGPGRSPDYIDDGHSGEKNE